MSQPPSATTRAEYSRASFLAARAAAKRAVGQAGVPLVLVAVVGGLAQLGFIRWLERSVDRNRAVSIEGTVFLVYMAAVLLLIWRFQRRQAAAQLHCPRCGAALGDLSTRIAAATGRCDTCGGTVITE